MKTKRNIRVAVKRQQTVHSVPAFVVPLPLSVKARSLRRKVAGGLMDILFKRPEKVLHMLEQDIAMQSERLAVLNEAVMLPLMQPQPVLVPVPADLQEPPQGADEGTEEYVEVAERRPVIENREDTQIAVAVTEPGELPSSEVPKKIANRRDYSRSLPPARVVRRRII